MKIIGPMDKINVLRKEVEGLTKVWLDAGHGGEDGGASGNGLHEKNLTLEITKKIAKNLEENYQDVQIMQTRTSDVFVSLDERTKRANAWGADLFLSVHINAATVPIAKGFETHIYTFSNDRTKAFQNVMHEEIMKWIGNKAIDRGKKASNFHVLRESTMAALLTENLFISNSGDAALLKQDEFLENLAAGHTIGLERFLGLKRIPTPIPPPGSSTLYQVIAGTFANKDNADKMAKNLQSDGYKAYVVKKEY